MALDLEIVYLGLAPRHKRERGEQVTYLGFEGIMLYDGREGQIPSANECTLQDVTDGCFLEGRRERDF